MALTLLNGNLVHFAVPKTESPSKVQPLRMGVGRVPYRLPAMTVLLDTELPPLLSKLTVTDWPAVSPILPSLQWMAVLYSASLSRILMVFPCACVPR